MDATTRREIKNLKVDPNFIEFVMGWHGRIGATDVPFTAEKESPAYQKKIKRWMKRDFGAKWKSCCAVIRGECWKVQRKMVLQRNLFKMEPRGPNPNYRRRNEALWSAVFDLRDYFEKINGRPHMGLLGRLFFPNELEATFHRGWDKRNDWFKVEKGSERLEQLELFNNHNRARIVDTLQSLQQERSGIMRVKMCVRQHEALPMNERLPGTNQYERVFRERSCGSWLDLILGHREISRGQFVGRRKVKK